MGSTALLLVGGIFTTAVCSMTPICEITFPGLTGINQAAARAMMSPEKIASAAAMVQDAIGKYQKLQKAATR
ncbi:unnamed protein product [Callosobruchus maculatus]|uniref:Uncharacterized protein n=1 Tax=Callosobruchus maculatus TaxID=64391 RepID=A0A653C3D5_CALMS|nr:unnamed protein product [Callosobruchus maculatus]